METFKMNHFEKTLKISSSLEKFMKSKLDNKLGEMSRKRILSKCYNERKECLNNCGLKWINKENNVDKNMINVSELFTWLLEQVDHWKVMESLNDIQAKIKSHDVTIIGFFYDENSSGAKIFKEVANNYKEYLCGLVNSKRIFDEYNAKDETIILFKKFDESQTIFNGKLVADEIESFIDVNSLPSIVHYDSKYREKIYSSGYENHLYICKSKNDHDFDEFIDGIKNSAEQFRGKMMFVIFDVDNDDEMNFLSSSLGIERDQLPSIIFDGIFGEERLLHKPENPFVTVENITKFIEQFYDDGIIKLILEQDLPQDWNEQMVKIVAGDNFSKVVLDTSKHVLVLFYQPDRHLELEMIMNELADEFRNYDDIGFAKLNLQANNLEVATSPTDADISLYKKETNEHVVYYGEQTKAELKKFINSTLDNSNTNVFYAKKITLN
ncbi:hypothetical protein HCN44_000059 [Aphidius gifuensis]|uniref:protein disulfide-isomerase n=1 Tax=Aphidius gifuensis TaxID=684658 RepID=A0A835CMY1_APHGI|nr:hypothetical protein HCN44_000059 [Aphidius gifuensis]